VALEEKFIILIDSIVQFSEKSIIHELGDRVVFRDGKDGRRHEGKIVGFDGPVALIRWRNMDRRVHERKLLPSFEVRQEAREETKEEEDESETEIIPEIQPRRRGPKRKKKTEIIPEISEKIVVRESKRNRKNDETDNKITREVWTEDEDQSHTTQNQYLTRPKLNYHIKAYNRYGEEFSGEVIEHHYWFRNQFRIREHSTSAEIMVDLKNINDWEYIDEPSSDRDEIVGIPTGRVLHASARNEENELIDSHIINRALYSQYCENPEYFNFIS